MNSIVRKTAKSQHYDQQVNALKRGCFKDPFSFLGVHAITDTHSEIRCYMPGATKVTIKLPQQMIVSTRYGDSDLFIAQLDNQDISAYQLVVDYSDCQVICEDVYSFDSSLDDSAMYLFNEGTLEHAYRHLGAHFIDFKGVSGVRFSVWAPNASSVSVIGEFNHWQQSQHFMRFNPASGVWDLFIPELSEGQCYKFSITTLSGEVLEKADPFATPLEILPEWYFFPTFNLLRVLPNKLLGVIAMAAVPAGLITVPFIENVNKFQNPFRRPLAMAVFLFGTAFAIWFGIGACLPIKDAVTLGLF